MIASRPQRQERIARIIQEHTVWSQQELQERLAKAGFEVTQATLSRDLTRMGVLKGPHGYLLPQNAGAGVNGGGATGHVAAGAGADVVDDEADVMLQRTLRRELRAIDAAGNLVIVRTDAGHANALAIEIDRARPTEIVGSIAGDDTIFLAASNDAAAKRLVKRFRSLTTSR
jgi:transcriptional regulator of arginine metabolism